ncbi:MAG: cupin domain-containing protein, partial [Euryarchaeota archaeon]|nr:cupin domain-containing protein [Euryarchaeota archaeon]
MTSSQRSVHVRRAEGTALWLLGELYEIKVDGEATGGPTVVQVTIPPGPVLGAPPHVHDCDELAYVLEGTLRYHFGDRTENASAGSVLFFPKGTTEWFENPTNQPAKLLIVYN